MDANPFRPPASGSHPEKVAWNPAPLWRRAVSLVVDKFIVVIGVFALSVVPWHLARPVLPTADESPNVAITFYDPKWLWLILCIAITTPLVYHTMLIWQRGATIGKQVMGIQILQYSGYRVTLQQSVTRLAFSWIGGILLGIGYLTAFFTRHRRALHDLIAGTVATDCSVLDRSTASDQAGADSAP